MGVYSGNRTLLGESIATAGPAHIMDLVIEAEQNDLHMFNAVINSDFIEAYSEAGLISLTEEDKSDAKSKTNKGIIEKIKDLFKKAIAKITEFVSTFIAKIKNLISNDAKLYKKYKENFSKNGNGYEISGWKPLKAKDPGATATRMVNNVKVQGMIKIDSLDRAGSTEEISSTVDSILKGLKDEVINNFEGDFFGDKAETAKLTSEEVSIIEKVMHDSNSIIKGVQNSGKACINQLKDMQSQFKLEKVRDEQTDLSTAILNAKYKVAGAYVKFTSKKLNAACNLLARYIASCRRAFVLAGKKGLDTATEESAQLYDAVLSEASNDYVESMLLSV